MNKENKIEKAKWALYRAVGEAKPERVTRAKWVLYGAIGISSLLLFGCDGPQYPKIPRSYGD